MYKTSTVKPVLSGHSKIDKTKVLMENDSLMEVKSTAECSTGAFCNTFDLHLAIIGLKNLFFGLLLSGGLRQVLLYWYENLMCRQSPDFKHVAIFFLMEQSFFFHPR